MQLGNYDILQKIHESETSDIYRGKNIKNKNSVIIKILNKNHPEGRIGYKREYDLTHLVHSPHVVKSLDLLTANETVVLIKEDVGVALYGKF